MIVELMWGVRTVTKARGRGRRGELANMHAWSRSGIYRTSPHLARWRLLPMTSPTSPISAAAKQQHQNDDDEDQFHEKSPWLL
jgi:hypothetical protein